MHTIYFWTNSVLSVRVLSRATVKYRKKYTKRIPKTPNLHPEPKKDEQPKKYRQLRKKDHRLNSSRAIRVAR